MPCCTFSCHGFLSLLPYTFPTNPGVGGCSLDGVGVVGASFACERGLPLVVLVGPGLAGDSPMFSILFDHLRVPCTAARPPRFDAEKYKRRNTIERGFCEVKQWRGLATGYATPSQVPFTLRRFSQHLRARRGGWPMRV